MKLYLPSTVVSLDSFVVNGNQVGCTFQCKFRKSWSVAGTESWLEMHAVAIEGMPMFTNDFSVMLPVQLLSGVMSMYIGFEARGIIVGVYRFGGSAVK